MSLSGATPNRGHTNLLTGGVRLLDVPAEYLNKYTIRGRLPRPFLASFLHESTHYWCTASPLGAVLALLEMRAHRSMILGQNNHDQLFHDMVVSEATHLILKPLLEGMALFMEFDCFPGESEVWAAPSMWAGQLFAPLDELPDDKISLGKWLSDHILPTIIDYRSSREAHDRKTEILMQSFDEDPHFYLPGYLTVKVLFGIQATRTAHFQDRDLFLHFLRDWFFRDWVLVGHLLNDELAPSAACSLISERLQERLDVLLRTNLSSEAAAFEKDIAENQYGENTQSLRLQSHEVTTGIDRYNAFMSRFTNHGDITTGEIVGTEAMIEADLLTLQHRQRMLRLAVEKVEIEVNENKRVFVRKLNAPRESFYLSGPALPEAVPGTTPGWLAMYYVPEHRAIITIALRNNHAVLWFRNGVPDEDETAALRFAATKTVATEEDRAELTALCRALMRSHDHDINPLDLGWREHVLKVYERTALAICLPEKRAGLPQVLGRKGLYDALGKDGDLLTTFVAMSLFPFVDDQVRAMLTSLLERDGISFSSCLKRLEKIQERTGLQLFVTSESGRMLCTA